MRTLYLLFLIPLAFGGGTKEITQTNSKIYTNRSNGGLSSATIMLSDDNNFFYESGSEGTSHISAGIWEMKEDTLLLDAAYLNEVEPISEVIRSRNEHSDSIRLRIISLGGDTLKYNYSPVLYNKNHETPSYTQYMDNSYRSESGEFVLDTRLDQQIIELKKLSYTFNRDVIFETKGYNDFTVFLNFPAMCLWGTEIYYQEYLYSDKFLVKGDSLLSLPAHPFSLNFVLKKR